MPLYDTKTVTLAVVAGGPWVKFMNANPRRVVLLYSDNLGAGARLNTKDSGIGGPFIVTINPALNDVMRYADFGPIIQDEIFLANAVQSPTITLTEVFYVG